MFRPRGAGAVDLQRRIQEGLKAKGEQMSAQNVAYVESQLEELQVQLRTLAAKHKNEIKKDPAVRARFRQLADSLGVDLFSSKKNTLAGALGIGDFYFELAARVVEVCMKETAFCGFLVPLQQVQRRVQKQYDETAIKSSDHGKNTEITEEDIATALSKLSVLGEGYEIVQFGTTKFIATVGMTQARDEVKLINLVLSIQKEQVRAANQLAAAIEKSSGSRAAAERQEAGGMRLFLNATSKEDAITASTPVSAQCVSLTARQICDQLAWNPTRAASVLQWMVQQGSVWVEEPKEAVLRAVEHVKKADKEVWRAKKKVKVMPEEDLSNVVYWFISVTTLA